jgi:hypothetical protein
MQQSAPENDPIVRTERLVLVTLYGSCFHVEFSGTKNINHRLLVLPRSKTKLLVSMWPRRFSGGDRVLNSGLVGD